MKERTVEMVVVLGIKPKGQGRPRFSTRTGRVFTPSSTREYIETVRDAVKEYWRDREPLSGAVAVRVEAVFELPKSARKPRTHHTQKPDLDNITKAVLDALTPVKKGRGKDRKIIWPGVLADDALVVDLHARKDWSIVGDTLSITVWSVT